MLNRPNVLTALAKLFSEPQYLVKSGEEDPNVGLTAVDYEEQTAGYQAAYSRLAASERAPEDPTSWVRDPQEYFGQELSRAAKANGRIVQLVGAADQSIVGPFIQSLRAAGVAF
jgi:exportin-2 (importin alpha re-exporter)